MYSDSLDSLEKSLPHTLEQGPDSVWWRDLMVLSIAAVYNIYNAININRIVKVYENMIKDKVILMSISADCLNKCQRA